MAEPERKVLEREFEWLLDMEYQLRAEAINSQLQDCSKKLTEAFFSSGGGGIGGDLRPILISQGDSVLCTAAIEGDKIVKAEINLKLPGRGSKPIRTTIKEHYPWKLKQIQDCANYLSDACNHLEEIQGSYKQTQPKAPSEKTGRMSSKPTEIRKSFQRLIHSLRRAESTLVLPHPRTALHIYNAEQKATLRPVLPEDLVLHFHISSAMLVLTILTVTQMSRTPTTPNVGTSVTSSTYWVGSTFEQGSNAYEVSSQLQVRSLIPWVAVVLQLIQGMLEIAQDFIDKVKVFEAMGL